MAQDRVTECLEGNELAPNGLYNEWEMGFLSSIEYKTELTDKQEAKLSTLYERACKSIF